ncbi:hypothetical protein BGZ96_003784 [Linnemannia gamsii]|uniref:Thioredoxin domain-containing protein n=1 Tax=Linnemannia gamsii TaxID=64522 RepID=A0ABQ7K9C8_9FUNG|nr:hypothetical protein BGZ96_003784 [Linnemannia gamsii]
MSSTVVNDTHKTKDEIIRHLYIEVLSTPFQDKYGDNWDEALFLVAIEDFKTKAKKAEIEDPLVFLGKVGFGSFDNIRDSLKEGPPECFRQGWQSELLSHKVDVRSVLDRCEVITGVKYEGVEKIVVLDFWACWCVPCAEAAPELSKIAEEHAGKVAVVGINNENMFKDKEQDVERLKGFLAENKDTFRYTNVVDKENHARDSVFSHCGYQAIPCLVVVVNNIVSYVGSPGRGFERALRNSLDAVAMEE